MRQYIMTSLFQGLASPQEEIRSTGTRHKSRSSDERSPDLDLSAGSSQHQTLLMLAAQHGLTPQQLQQVLMTQQGATVPPHVQQLLQAQQSVVMVTIFSLLFFALIDIIVIH